MSIQPIDIRAAVRADATAIADVHVAAWRTTYTGIISQAYLDALAVDERAAAWQRRLVDGSATRSEIFVAESSAGILGFIAGGPRHAPVHDYDAQLHAIYLLAEAKGHGIGRRLTQVWAAAAVARGCAAAIVDVMATNPARGFYERLGARYLEDREVIIGGEPYIEARYGWADLRALAA